MVKVFLVAVLVGLACVACGGEPNPTRARPTRTSTVARRLTIPTPVTIVPTATALPQPTHTAVPKGSLADALTQFKRASSYRVELELTSRGVNSSGALATPASDS